MIDKIQKLHNWSQFRLCTCPGWLVWIKPERVPTPVRIASSELSGRDSAASPPAKPASSELRCGFRRSPPAKGGFAGAGVILPPYRRQNRKKRACTPSGMQARSLFTFMFIFLSSLCRFRVSYPFVSMRHACRSSSSLLRVR